MTRIHEEPSLNTIETLDSLWEQFERTGSVQAFVKFQQLSTSDQVLESPETGS